MHVALDLDDVILDFVGGLLACAKKEHDVDIPEEAIRQWDLRPVLNPIIGYDWWDWLRERERLWPNFPAVNGAIGGIERLHRAGHYLEIVTSKPDWAAHNVWIWLGKWQPSVDRVTIVGPNDRKRDFTDAQFLVDDKLENLRGFKFPILFTRPHNSNIDISIHPGWPLLWRANNWHDVVEIINGLDSK